MCALKKKIKLEKNILRRKKKICTTKKQMPVITANGLQSLAVHFVVFVGVGEVQASVAFLVDEQVREVAFLELQFDRFDEGCTDLFGGLLAQFHGLLQCGNAEFDHDRVGIAVNNFGVVLIAIRFGVSE